MVPSMPASHPYAEIKKYQSFGLDVVSGLWSVANAAGQYAIAATVRQANKNKLN